MALDRVTDEPGDAANLTAHELDELIEGPIGPVEPRKLPQVVSVRFDPDVIAALRHIAHRRGITLSQLLREGALAAAREPHVITWLTPPTQASPNGTSVTFTAPGPDWDLRSLLRGVDESIAAHQAQIVHLMRMRDRLAEAADNADIDARHNTVWTVT